MVEQDKLWRASIASGKLGLDASTAVNNLRPLAFNHHEAERVAHCLSLAHILSLYASRDYTNITLSGLYLCDGNNSRTTASAIGE